MGWNLGPSFFSFPSIFSSCSSVSGRYIALRFCNSTLTYTYLYTLRHYHTLYHTPLHTLILCCKSCIAGSKSKPKNTFHARHISGHQASKPHQPLPTTTTALLASSILQLVYTHTRLANTLTYTPIHALIVALHDSSFLAINLSTSHT